MLQNEACSEAPSSVPGIPPGFNSGSSSQHSLDSYGSTSPGLQSTSSSNEDLSPRPGAPGTTPSPIPQGDITKPPPSAAPMLPSEISNLSSHIPSRVSATNLEEMIGSSLFSAINNVDHHDRQQHAVPIPQVQPGSGHVSPVVEPQPMVRSFSAEEAAPGQSHYPIPGSLPMMAGRHQPLAQSYPPTVSPSFNVLEERYSNGGSPPVDMNEKMIAAAAAAVNASARNKMPPPGTNLPAPNQRSSLFETTAGVELVQFLMDTESRALILFNVEGVPLDVLRMACESLGSLAYFHAEHKSSKGVVFVAYHDVRASLRAFHMLPPKLSPLAHRPVLAHYSIMLNAANTPREGILLIKDVQGGVCESDVHAVFSGYGQLKNVHRRITNQQNHQGMVEIFLVEYYDMQDAKVAAYELSTTTPWGPNVAVEEAERPEKERILGGQLMLIRRRWAREDERSNQSSSLSGDDCLESSPSSGSSNVSPPQFTYTTKASYAPPAATTTVNAPIMHPHYGITAAGAAQPAAAYYGVDGLSPAVIEDQLCGGFQSLWVMSPHAGVYLPQRNVHREDMEGAADPEYQLDVEKVLRGLDRRTTIMIRNIPNRYTQQLLLHEINQNHRGQFDFLYLPVDFNGKGNKGYCFINFIDYRAIVPFFRDFNGLRWKNLKDFNSDKVCVISYARIQGKQAIVRRFQNSAIWEQDSEYWPLFFHSSGPKRGQPEPFPLGNKYLRRIPTPLSIYPTMGLSNTHGLIYHGFAPPISGISSIF